MNNVLVLLALKRHVCYSHQLRLHFKIFKTLVTHVYTWTTVGTA